MLPIYVYLSHFNFSGLTVFIFFGGPALGYMNIHMTHLYGLFLYLAGNVFPQFGSPGRFTSALPVVLLLMV